MKTPLFVGRKVIQNRHKLVVGSLLFSEFKLNRVRNQAMAGIDTSFIGPKLVLISEFAVGVKFVKFLENLRIIGPYMQTIFISVVFKNGFTLAGFSYILTV